MTNLTTLDSAIWHRAVKTTTAGELPPHDGPVLYQVNGGDFTWYARVATIAFASHVIRYRPVNPDGTTGDLVERATITERVWSVTPPNDDTLLLVMLSDGWVHADRGKYTQTPGWTKPDGTTHKEAWCLLSDLLAPRPVVEVTEAIVQNAFAKIYGYVPTTYHVSHWVAHLNAVLRGVTP